jgi:hypothetical protein
MKLKFTRTEKGEISLTIDKKVFDTHDYLEIVKELKTNKKLELDKFDEKISPEEQASIESMVDEINSIKFDNDPNTN